MDKSDMNNPYASPAADTEPDHPSIWVTQTRLVAILLIAQGACECAVGFLLTYQWVKSSFAIAIICLVLALAFLKIIAGIRNYQRRDWALGIIALGTWPLGLFTFFCVPSAIVIMVYGLVVYLRRDVKAAFGCGRRPKESAGDNDETG